MRITTSIVTILLGVCVIAAGPAFATGSLDKAGHDKATHETVGSKDTSATNAGTKDTSAKDAGSKDKTGKDAGSKDTSKLY